MGQRSSRSRASGDDEKPVEHHAEHELLKGSGRFPVLRDADSGSMSSSLPLPRPKLESHASMEDMELSTEFADSIHVLFLFWQDNIAALYSAAEGTEEHDGYMELCMCFYACLFKRLPACRSLFLSVDIKKQALLYMGMMGWLTRRLAAPNAENVIS